LKETRVIQTALKKSARWFIINEGFLLMGFRSNCLVCQLPAVQRRVFSSCFKHRYTKLFVAWLLSVQQLHRNAAFSHRSAVPALPVAQRFLINGFQAENLKKVSYEWVFFLSGFSHKWRIYFIAGKKRRRKCWRVKNQ